MHNDTLTKYIVDDDARNADSNCAGGSVCCYREDIQRSCIHHIEAFELQPAGGSTIATPCCIADDTRRWKADKTADTVIPKAVLVEDTIIESDAVEFGATAESVADAGMDCCRTSSNQDIGVDNVAEMDRAVGRTAIICLRCTNSAKTTFGYAATKMTQPHISTRIPVAAPPGEKSAVRESPFVSFEAPT
ncbi:pristinamycin IIA synthase subunit A [Pseudozyma hubeiensis SY62]|uniref:Pristinamycin IIA synthase subunit A n=1 Tax=Pseudozyma hubeiensis (strain SY62) TaxID=1305764 RepID=R9PC37_PSEHS|nr:pristinamycin IIA synthase subunit A [Pseudozyma hubeiensis SY62]GAC98787.1 pristinamycin IIA synthase subunit A [Pseudozyma hubeiensis SY62]